MRKIALFLLSLSVLGAEAQKSDFDISEFYPVESMHSYVSFSATYMGYAKVKGNFEEFSCMFRYDPDDISKTSVTFSLETGSIDTDLEWRDNDLKSANWLDAENFPRITFQSKKVNPGDGGFEIIGDLTIKEVTKEITIKMNPASGILKDIRGDIQVIFSGEYVLDRTEYGVEGKRWSQLKEGIAGVADDISIEFSMLGKQIQKENFSSWVRNEDRPPGRLFAAYKKGGVDQTFAEFEKMKDEMEVNEKALGTVGYMLLKQGDTNDAIKIFERNAAEFSEESNAVASLAEAYATAGDLDKAKGQYVKTLEMDANNVEAKEVLRYLK